MAWVVGLGLLALATVLPVAVSVFRGDYRPRSRFLFDLIGTPSAAFAAYLASGLWQVGIIALVIFQFGSAEAQRLVSSNRGQAGARGRAAGLRLASWAFYLMAFLSAVLSLEGALRPLLYVYLIKGLYGFTVADHSKVRSALGSLGVYGIGIAAVVATAVLLVLSEYTYGNPITAPWLAIFIYRVTIMAAIMGILTFPLALWVDAGEPGSRS